MFARRSSFDEVVISTLPRRVSHWLRLDPPARAERLGVPVRVGRAGDAVRSTLEGVLEASIELHVVAVEKPEELNLILGQAHFIKTVEDLHETLAGAVPGLRFGIAFCESSGPKLVRRSSNDPELVELARRRDGCRRDRVLARRRSPCADRAAVAGFGRRPWTGS